MTTTVPEHPPVYLVTGDREWGGRDDLRLLHGVLETLPRGSILVCGWARGADRMAADHWSRTVQGPVIGIPYFGWLRRRGGPVRNRFMLYLLQVFVAAGHEVEVLAFHRDLDGRSRGTKDMVEVARGVGFRVTLYPVSIAA